MQVAERAGMLVGGGLRKIGAALNWDEGCP